MSAGASCAAAVGDTEADTLAIRKRMPRAGRAKVRGPAEKLASLLQASWPPQPSRLHIDRGTSAASSHCHGVLGPRVPGVDGQLVHC